MATANGDPALYVLRVEAVRDAIAQLQARRVHPFFLAYLHLRKRAHQAGRLENLQPRWRDLEPYLEVPGGPPGRPFYRPFVHEDVHDPLKYWFNRNLAGSFAPSSIREVPRRVVEVTGKTFSLRRQHTVLARRHLLNDLPLPVAAMAIFLYRNVGFPSPPNPRLLEQMLRNDFGFPRTRIGQRELEILFSSDSNALRPEAFEPLTPATPGYDLGPFARLGGSLVRRLSAQDLDLWRPEAELAEPPPWAPIERATPAAGTTAPSAPAVTPLPHDDPLLARVRSLLPRFGGVIFSGPSGTSKSWYAARIGETLTGGDPERIRYLQFHPSYQYEDFMEGFVPRASGTGFELAPKHFVEMCRRAEADSDTTHVVVIDELSRGEPGRVFGEALTYVERSKRGRTFQLASGEKCTVPHNLVVLATMNPMDRGVDEVDAAFERRFAKIAMEPDREILARMLTANGLADPLHRRVLGFFNVVNGMARSNPRGAVGHAYFVDVRDEHTLQDVWDCQLRFLIDRAYRLDPDTIEEIRAKWERMFGPEPDESEPGD